MTQPLIVGAGIRNVSVHGCSYQGGSAAGGTVGGTVLNYQNNSIAVQVGDPTYAQDTSGFNITDLLIVTASGGTAAKALYLYRCVEANVERLYIIGNQSTGQIGFTLDGTGNYTGGSFYDIHIAGFGTAFLLTGHLAGSVSDDYSNASTFVKVHIDCPTSGGSPISGTYGWNVSGGDGNSWLGGDVEGCATMFHLGPNAINNTVVGLRNENSTTQYVADSGSSYNNVVTGGTFFTGDLSDSGSRNSFWDSFHRTTNGVNGDWYASQVDATLTDHQRLGIGLGNERGRLTEIQTDFGYRWLYGFSDATAGEQFYELQDVLNNVNRIAVGQYNSGSGNTNNQTAINAAGTGAVILNGSNNSGTGGTIFGSGGASSTQVASVDSAGDITLDGSLEWYVGTTLEWEWECAQAGSCALHDANATNPLNVISAYQNAGTVINSQGSAAVAINNTSNAGTGGFIVYEGGSNYNTAAFTVSGSGAVVALSNIQAGTASGTGNVVVGNHLNQYAANDFAGLCTMSGGSTCAVSLQHSFSSTAGCVATDQGSNHLNGSCAIATNVCTVTSSSVNSDTWACLVFGNPN